MAVKRTLRHLLTALALAMIACVSWAATPVSNALTFDAVSMRGHFHVRLQPDTGRPPIGPLHSWTLRLTDSSGQALGDARLAVGGGMAAHGHGLPTQPTVTDHLGDGHYKIDGVKFNMAGDWILRLGIEHGNTRDIAEISFHVDF